MEKQNSTPSLFARITGALCAFAVKLGEKAHSAAVVRRENAHAALLARHQKHLLGKVFQLPNGTELTGEDLKVCQVAEVTDADELPESEYHLICLHEQSGEYYQIEWYGFSSEIRVSACDKFYAEGQIRKAELAVQGIDYHPDPQKSASDSQGVVA